MKSMRWNRTTDATGPLAEVNMTPLIDVSLVLVVILLLATPLAFESNLGVRRTATAVKDAGEAAVAPQVRLDIVSESKVAVNNTVVAVQDLPAVLAPLLAGPGRSNVAVSCPAQVTHGTFVQVLDIAKLSGAMGVAVTESEPGVRRQ